MAIIPEGDKQTLRELFARELESEVSLLLFVRPDSTLVLPDEQQSTCSQARELADELVNLTDKLKLEVHDASADPGLAREYRIDKLPALVLVGPRGANIRFFGVPSGYEFAAMLGDVLNLSKHRIDLSEQARQELEGLAQEVHLQVFVSPTCPWCPRAARLAHQMAMVSPKVLADVVDAEEFTLTAQRYEVTAVPKIVINNRVSFTGVQPEARLLSEIRRALETDEAGAAR